MPLTSDSSKSFYYDIDLQNNVLFNAKIHPVTTAERSTLGGSLNSDDKGLFVYDTDQLGLYLWDGNEWQAPSLSQEQLDKIDAAYNQVVVGLSITRTETTATITLTKRDGSALSTSFAYAYVHTQGPALASWVITHNLGKYPSITIVDTANTEVIGEVTYNSINQLTVSFSAAFSGKAYLN